MKNILFIILVVFLTNVFAQSPAHFKVGESELAGIHIYDIFQDQELNYWIASDNGLYKFDGYEFVQIECPGMLSPSLFNIVSDQKSSLYCHNLSGQIFRVKNDTCTLFYEIPDSLMNSTIDMKISDKGRFFVVTYRIFEILPDKSLNIYQNYNVNGIELYDSENAEIAAIGMGTNNEILNFEIIGDELTVSKLKLFPTDEPRPTKITLINRDGQLYAVESFLGKIYSIDRNAITLISDIETNEYIMRIFSAKDDFWILNTTLGIKQFKNIKQPNEGQLRLFQNYKISCYLEDNEGNLLFGTFRDGILVIPPTQLVTIDLGDLTGKINLLSNGPNETIFFGTNDGIIGTVSPEGEVNQFTFKTKGTIEFMEYLKHDDAFLLCGTSSYLFDLKSLTSVDAAIGSIKDFALMPNNQYLIGSNTGATIVNTSVALKSLESQKGENNFAENRRIIYNRRCYSVGYDSLNQSTYLGTSLGLKRIHNTLEEDLLLNGEEILSRDILFHHNRIYIASYKQGILIYENDKLIKNWTAENELISNSTHQILAYKDYLVVSTDQGIQIMDKTGETKWYFNKSDGLTSIHPFDMVISSSYLWILNQNGLQRIDLEKLTSEEFKPNISFFSLKMNDIPIQNHEEIGTFDYYQNKFEVDFRSLSLKNRNEITYRYRLVGVEKDWQQNSYFNHKIDYKTLPPGDYIFQVQAVWRKSFSETLSYRFIIGAPFWTRWWFYVLIFVLLFSLIFYYFYRVMKNQRRKSKLQEELYESKLTAIQAQMNPHFIFNSLNSIQDLVLKNDAENAYIYISKFALLVRNTLTHSDKDFIDFSDEINSLRLYLTLEKLRFKNAFNFEITANEDCEIQIPPMLVQPFIENSLIHGLLHKEGQKTLFIHFEIKDAVICTITDNGIGREEAKRIQERQFSNHESFALSAIKRRLEILELRFGGSYHVDYIDLIKDGEPIGTQVIIHIPYLKND